MHDVTIKQGRPGGWSVASAVASDTRDDTVLKLLRQQCVLSRLPEADLLTLARHSTIRTLRQDHILFRSGDEGRSAVLVVQGYVKLSSMAAGGREVVLEIAGPGTMFGELAVLNGWPRKADARTLTPCRVLAIDGGLFRQTIARTPEAMFALMRLLSERLAVSTEQGVDSVSLPAPVRLAKALLHLAALNSQQTAAGVDINFRLSQRELGAMTGLTRESINKHLKAWRAAGWVRLSGSSMTLSDVAALRDFVRDNEAR